MENLDTRFVESIANRPVDVLGLRKKYDEERRARLRPDRADQFARVSAEFSHYVDDPYVDGLDDRAPVNDTVDVVIVGAGHAGLLAGARLRQAGFDRIRLIDKAGDVGGTWYWNRYPGIQCDIDSYIYLPLLEETGYLPTLKYAYGAEIFEHAQRVARHFELYRDSLFQTQVTSAKWDEAEQVWRLTTDRADEISTRFLVIANGALSKPKLPGIPGIDEFRGHTFHSSRWDYDYTGGNERDDRLVNLADKRVGVIGTGATAIQIVPHLATWAKELVVLQRTPSVVGVRANRPTDADWAASLTPGWQAERTRNFTEVVSGTEPDLDLVDDGWTEIQKSITRTAAVRAARKLGRELTPEEAALSIEVADLEAGEALRDRVDAVVTANPEAAAALKAWYFLYCKRPCFHDEYLDTFNRANVRLVQTEGTGVERLTAAGVLIGGKEQPLDCLIFASGFEVATSYQSQIGYDPVGRRGVRLSERWAKGPRTYHGLQSAGFPNAFFMGIIQNASVLNFTHLLDEQATHLAYIAREARDQGIAAIEPTKEAEAEWQAEMDRYATDAERERWLRCTPGYINGEGDVDNPFGFFARRYGGGPVRFFARLREWREAGDLHGLTAS